MGYILQQPDQPSARGDRVPHSETSKAITVAHICQHCNTPLITVFRQVNIHQMPCTVLEYLRKDMNVSAQSFLSLPPAGRFAENPITKNIVSPIDRLFEVLLQANLSNIYTLSKRTFNSPDRDRVYHYSLNNPLINILNIHRN